MLLLIVYRVMEGVLNGRRRRQSLMREFPFAVGVDSRYTILLPAVVRLGTR